MSFQLSESEKQSGQWGRLSLHLEERLDALRKQNDDPGKTEADTAFLRGQIAEIKRLIELGKTRPEVNFPGA